MTKVYTIHVYTFGVKAMHTHGAERDLNDRTRWWLQTVTSPGSYF